MILVIIGEGLNKTIYLWGQFCTRLTAPDLLEQIAGLMIFCTNNQTDQDKGPTDIIHNLHLKKNSGPACGSSNSWILKISAVIPLGKKNCRFLYWAKITPFIISEVDLQSLPILDQGWIRIYQGYSVTQSYENSFWGYVVLDTFNNVSRYEDNILDQIYIKQMCSDVYNEDLKFREWLKKMHILSTRKSS